MKLKDKSKIIVALFCLIQLNMYAGRPIQVLDRATKQAVADASVYFPDSKTGTMTDEKGVFSVNTQNVSVFVQISCLGYKTFLGYAETPVVYLEPSFHDLQEVVVSGVGSKLQGENVLNVGKISLVNNPEMQGLSLTQKLTGTAGLANFSTGAGIGKPVIRGLSGNRIAVFSQGVRMENQQWGDEHGLGLDENGYEEVEIIKGPASLLYGSDALGGVLYFADERYAKENCMEAVVNSEYNTNTAGLRNTGAFKWSKNRLHWNVFGGYTSHRDYKDGNDNRVDNSRFRTGDFKTSFGYTGDKWISSLKYSFLNEQYGLTETGEESDFMSANGRKPQFPYQNLTTHLLSFENTFFFENNSKLKINAGYVFNNRKEFEEENEAMKADLAMNLSTFSFDAKWYSPKQNKRWNFIVGTQGMSQTNANQGEELLIPDAATADLGVFATSDYYYSENSYWQAGLRVDGRHVTGKQHTGEEISFPSFSETYTAINFSTGIFQMLTKEFSLRAGLSSGYRSPNMFELLSHGVHEGTNRYEIGDSRLKVENAYQMDVSFDYKSEHLQLFVNPYLNYIRNYIYLKPAGETEEDLPVFYYAQTDACLYGGEAGFHFHPHPLDWLHLEGSYSSTFGQDAGHNDLPLMPAQKINATVRTSFHGKRILEKFSLFLQNQYSFSQKRIADYETTTASSNLVNAGLSFEFQLNGQKILFNAAVNNLFNTTYYDHLSRYKQNGIYNPGRNLIFRLSLPISPVRLQR